MNAATQVEDEAVREVLGMTADTIGQDLLAALVQEIKLLPDVWPKLPKAKQDDVIARLNARVRHNVVMAIHLIATQGRVNVVADLEGVAIKDETKATFKIARGNAADALQHLYESVGKACLLIVADAQANMGDMDSIKGDPDQRAMDLGQEYDPNGDGQDMAGDVIDADLKQIGHDAGDDAD